jgi:hypothetical protein
MSDTIELLETIGRDASLRHASAEELAHVLRQSQASEALTAAVASGDRSKLSVELGKNTNLEPQASQTCLDEEEPNQSDKTPDAPSSPDSDTSPADESNR